MVKHMKPEQIHVLLSQSPYIKEWPDDDDPYVAECALWEQENITLIIDFAQNQQDENHFHQCCIAIQDKLNWLAQNQSLIHQECKLQPQNTAISYISYYVEDADTIFTDMVLTACDDPENILAEISIEEDNTIIV